MCASDARTGSAGVGSNRDREFRHWPIVGTLQRESANIEVQPSHLKGIGSSSLRYDRKGR